MRSQLQIVTITGADDRTDIHELIDLSAEFPFVEWGILVSKRQEGSYRFPSRRWVDLFTARWSSGMRVSTHVCGAWVRDMLVGKLNWQDLPMCADYCQRVQVNTHAEKHVVTTGLLTSLFAAKDKQFIFQWDGINNLLAHATHAYGLNVSALFDTSGGAGVLPESWPQPAAEFWCGYAGGLGPDNVEEQLGKIAAVCKKPFWIDMERRVRTQDDSSLDMTKVRSVLTSMAKHVDPGPSGQSGRGG